MGMFHAHNKLITKIVGNNYGYLYNQYATIEINSSLITNTDWIVPFIDDFGDLISFLGDYNTSGGFLKEIGVDSWSSPNNTLLPNSNMNFKGCGYRDRNGIFEDKGIRTRIASDSPISNVKYHELHNSGTNVTKFINRNAKYGKSIRLLYNGTGEPTTMTDYDNNVYDVIKIGNQYWTTSNYKCTHLNNGTALTKVTGNSAWEDLNNEGYCAYDNDLSNV